MSLAPTLVRIFPLTDSVDVDPLTQPASDYLGDLVSGFGSRVLIHAWLVDADGVPQDPGALTVDVTVCWVHSIEVPRVEGTVPNAQLAWGRGPIATTKVPGLGLTQAELADVVGFQVAITGKSASPAGMRLAIYATKGPR